MDLSILAPLLIKRADEPVMASRITPENAIGIMAVKFAAHQLRKQKIMEAIRLYERLNQ